MPDTTARAEPKYDAFISYRRSDGSAAAHWLRRELQAFRLPKSLRGTHQRKLSIYLDTAYERATADFYAETIRPALLSSRWLFVIATPDAVGRPVEQDWMRREVADFARGPYRRNVVAIRAAGDFRGPLPADLETRYPNIEIVDLRGASRFAFLNPARASRLANEKLKLIAPLIQLAPEAMPRLRQEEEKLQQTRLGAVTGGSLAVLTAVSATSIYALAANFRASRALEDSMFATGRMVLTINSSLSRDGPDAELRSNLLNQGCDLLDKLGVESDREPQIREIVVCRIERGRSREQLKEYDLARKELDDAIARAVARHTAGGRLDAAQQITTARQELAEYLVRQKSFADAEAEYVRLRDDARRLLETHDVNTELVTAEAEGSGQLGDFHRARGESAEAEASYLAAADAIRRAIEWESGRNAAYQFEWQARLFRLAGDERRKLDDARGALRHYERALEILVQFKPNELTFTRILDGAETRAYIFVLQRFLGDQTAADTTRQEALAAISRVTAAANADADDKLRAGKIKSYIESSTE